MKAQRLGAASLLGEHLDSIAGWRLRPSGSRPCPFFLLSLGSHDCVLPAVCLQLTVGQVDVNKTVQHGQGILIRWKRAGLRGDGISQPGAEFIQKKGGCQGWSRRKEEPDHSVQVPWTCPAVAVAGVSWNSKDAALCGLEGIVALGELDDKAFHGAASRSLRFFV